jgi:hypothetical protein
VQDAVVRGEAGQHDLAGVCGSEDGIQADRGRPVVLEERGITVDVAVDAFPNDRRMWRNVQRGVKLGPSGSSDAVVRPEDLLAVGERDGCERLPARMAGKDRTVNGTFASDGRVTAGR